MVQEYKTTQNRIKGKLCHFQKDDFKRHNLEEYYWKDIKDVNLEELKNKMVEILKKEGFVFFETIDYKYITNFGKLVEMAINFHHIL